MPGDSPRVFLAKEVPDFSRLHAFEEYRRKKYRDINHRPTIQKPFALASNVPIKRAHSTAGTPRPSSRNSRPGSARAASPRSSSPTTSRSRSASPRSRRNSKSSGRSSPSASNSFVDDEDAAEARARKALIKHCIAQEEQGLSTPEVYSFGKTLGEGAYGKVKLAVHHLTGVKVAIKTLEKSRLQDVNSRRRAQREIKMMQILSHTNIIKLYEVIDSPLRKYLVIEHCSGGDLCHKIRMEGSMSEKAAAAIFVQCVDGLLFCHRNNIVHRDVKLDNILLDGDNVAKIVDFGFSTEFVDGVPLKKACGSPSYAAPEIVSRTPYMAAPIDVWSLGVVLYAVIAGTFPFRGQDNDDLCNKIIRGRYAVPAGTSLEYRDLLRRMLCVDPARRITLEQARTHAWLKMHCPLRPDHAEHEAAQMERQRRVDEEVMAELRALGFPRPYVVQSIGNHLFNFASASYWMVQKKKAAGGQVHWTLGTARHRAPE